MFKMEYLNKASLIFVFVQVYCMHVKAVDAAYCDICSTEPTICRHVSGTFAVTVMSKGYNPVVTVPVGACFLNVTEKRRSENYLALKSASSGYILNGMWIMNSAGTYHGAGTVFQYARADGSCPGDCIYSKGPIREPVTVQLLYHNVSPGVDYSYKIPYYLEENIQNSQNGPGLSGKQTADDTSARKISSEAPSDRSPSETGNVRSALKDSGSYYSAPQEQTDVTQHRRRIDQYRQSANRRRRPMFSSDFKRSWKNRRQGTYRRHHTDQRQPLRESSFSINVGSPDAQELPEITAGLDPIANIINIDLASNQTGVSEEITLHNDEDYVWRVSGYTECSLTCGGGIKQPILGCYEIMTGAPAATSYCQEQIKPELNAAECNKDACLPDWEPGPWTECSTTCGEGQQVRPVICQQRISPANIVNLTEDQCLRSKPADTKPCYGPSCYGWKTSAWSDCSVLCGTGVRSRSVYCENDAGQIVNDSHCSQPQPRPSRSCDLGSCARNWYFSHWNNRCSSDCGSGYTSRNVYCLTDSGQLLSDEECDTTEKPAEQRSCSQNIPCNGSWFTGPWSKCSVSCGEGLRQRPVMCVQKTSNGLFHVLDSSQCIEDEKPDSQETCTKDHCRTMWFMTDWSECSVSCGGGVKHRHVQCLNSQMKHSTLCSQSERPADMASCNEERCWTRPTSHSNGCVDRYPNCAVVVQTKLCRYPYYQRNCCRACSGWP